MSVLMLEGCNMLHRLRSLIIPVACLVGCLFLAGISGAQARPDTWVAPGGSDSGDCANAAPCRTFAYAYAQTSVNGSINVAAPGSYGPLTIAKAISIVADGVEAAILSAANGAAIRVEAPSDAVVVLRGLTIDMRGTANAGIAFVSGEALHVHRTTIRKAANGINFAPATGSSDLYVADTVVENTHGLDLAGIHVRPTGSAAVKVLIERVRVYDGDYDGILFNGFGTTGAIAATVSDSVAAGNNRIGIGAHDDASGGTKLMVERSAAVNSSGIGVGIFANGAGTDLWVGHSTATGNETGLHAQVSGEVISYGNNKVNGNTTDGAPSSTTAAR